MRAVPGNRVASVAYIDFVADKLSVSPVHKFNRAVTLIGFVGGAPLSGREISYEQLIRAFAPTVRRFVAERYGEIAVTVHPAVDFLGAGFYGIRNIIEFNDEIGVNSARAEHGV